MRSNTNRYYRTNAPKVTIKLWKCLERKTGFESNRRVFVRQLFDENADQFESEEHMKTTIKQSLEERLLAEDWLQTDGQFGKRFRFVPLMNRKQFFGQTNDYYCFECHSCGQNQPLIGCKSCFRAFHKLCLKNNKEIGKHIDLNRFECEYCQKQTNSLNPNSEDNNRLDQLSGKAMKSLIQMFFTRLEKSYIDFDIYSEFPLEKTPETDVLVFYFLDLSIIRRKVFELENYLSFAEFISDLRHFCHNFLVMNEESKLKPFVDIIDYELKELSRCLDCYRYSRALATDRLDPNEWFTRVCTPPHRLVFAKVLSHPYWPSKVIECSPDSTNCLVQFFEPKLFSRAEVSIDKIREIDYRFESKQLTSKSMLTSTQLLYKYLKNWKRIDFNFGFDKLLNRLELLLSNKLMKNKTSVLRKSVIDLKPKIKKNEKNLAKKRKFHELNESNDENEENYKTDDNEKNKTSDEFGGDEEKEYFSQMFTKLLESESIDSRIKANVCSIITDNECEELCADLHSNEKIDYFSKLFTSFLKSNAIERQMKARLCFIIFGLLNVC